MKDLEYNDKYKGISQSIEKNTKGDFELYMENDFKQKYKGDIDHIINSFDKYEETKKSDKVEEKDLEESKPNKSKKELEIEEAQEKYNNLDPLLKDFYYQNNPDFTETFAIPELDNPLAVQDLINNFSNITEITAFSIFGYGKDKIKTLDWSFKKSSHLKRSIQAAKMYHSGKMRKEIEKRNNKRT